MSLGIHIFYKILKGAGYPNKATLHLRAADVAHSLWIQQFTDFRTRWTQSFQVDQSALTRQELLDRSSPADRSSQIDEES